ncbi:hypothetical protein DH2020_043958 [Rehmannia glutinosa]|uniref:Uncharacterized protein n=1 Tax=Rehmannia glutinosa TaxID=99300 RepID=A0ABR0UIC8_REHGL
MSLSTLKPAVACSIPPATGANGSHSKVSKVTMMNRQAIPPLQCLPVGFASVPRFQVREKEKPLLQESFTATSRREMMHLTAASMGLLSLLLPASSAEARPRNATMRQKIMEKFEELRQKAGLSKPKDTEGEDKSMQKAETEAIKPKLKDGGEEKKVQNHHSTPNEEISIPALPNILNGKTVETTLP